MSTAFAAYYKHNLEKPTENKAATQVIDENNTLLTAHYDKHFKDLLGRIAKLGVPAVHGGSVPTSVEIRVSASE